MVWCNRCNGHIVRRNDGSMICEDCGHPQADNGRSLKYFIALGYIKVVKNGWLWWKGGILQ